MHVVSVGNTCIITDMILMSVRPSAEPAHCSPLLHKMPCFPRRHPRPRSATSVSLHDRWDHVFADKWVSMYDISLVLLSFPAVIQRFEALHVVVSALKFVASCYPITLFLFCDSVGRIRQEIVT